MNGILLPQKEFGVHEECGIFGVISPEKEPLAREVYYGLFALQHRGQESAGIAVNMPGRKIAYYKNMGLVNEVFSDEELELLPDSDIAIGHVRYSTCGSSNVVNAQPVVFYGRYGRMAIAHNGNIVNAATIKNWLIDRGHIFQSSVDSEVVAALINYYTTSSVENGVQKACLDFLGAFAIVCMADNKLIAVRDKYGLKPLVMGRKGKSVIFASESCALDAMGAEYVRDIEPGELVCVDDKFGVRSFRNFCGKRTSLCIYEYVYFSRPDSILDGNEVYAFREKAGRLLARACPADADIVCGVPDGGTVFAQGYANETGIPLKASVMKNKFSSRNLFTHDAAGRENAIKLKYNVLRQTVAGKRIALVDDSLMRGDTARRIVTMLKNAGAGAVHLRIGCPRILHKCIYGVQMPDERDLLASGGRTNEEMCAYLGCESIGFLPTDALKETGLSDKFTYCTSCLDGKLHMKSNS